MSLIIRDPEDGIPDTFRGTRSSAEVYVKDGDMVPIGKMPFWTLRGQYELHNLRLAARAYDAGTWRGGTIAEDETDEYMREIFSILNPLAQGVMGCVIHYDGCVIIPLVTVHPKVRNRGLMGKYLMTLPRNQTVIFPEVLPESVMPGMLLRRGFKVKFVADTEDDAHIFFPCYVRSPRSSTK